MQSEIYKSWIPQGFDFFGPKRTERLLSAYSALRDLFRTHSYSEVIPPALDYSPTFGHSERRGLESFETRDSDGNSLALRSDLTVQIVKAVATGRLGKDDPQRLSYIQTIYQDIPAINTHRREIIQAGVEQIGSIADGRVEEVMALAKASLSTLGVEAKIVYGDARFTEIILRQVPPGFRKDTVEALYTKDTDRLGRIGSLARFAPTVNTLLQELPLLFGKKEIFGELEKLIQPFPELAPLLKEALQHDDLIYDFSMVRELNYYSGPIFEAYTNGTSKRILSGGVYDDLYQKFNPMKKGACGFGIDLCAITDLVEVN